MSSRSTPLETTPYRMFSVQDSKDPLTTYDTVTQEKFQKTEEARIEKKSATSKYLGPFVSWFLLLESCTLLSFAYRTDSWSEDTPNSMINATKVALFVLTALSAFASLYFCKTCFGRESANKTSCCCAHSRTESLLPSESGSFSPVPQSSSPHTPIVQESNDISYSLGTNSPRSMPSGTPPLKSNSSGESPKSQPSHLQMISGGSLPSGISRRGPSSHTSPQAPATIQSTNDRA